MIKITDNQNRSILIEGRNNGMGFAFLKKTNNEEYETVQPISPCKDYLNEPVFTENTGFATKAYGLVYDKKLNIFDDYFYMVIKIMKTKDDTYHFSKSFDADVENLERNYINIQFLINYIEEQLEFKNRTVITKVEDNLFLIKGAVEWTISTIGISLFSLLVRGSLYYDGKEEPMTYLRNYKLSNQDLSYIQGLMPKLDIILKHKQIPTQPAYNEESLKKNYWTPHGVGIVSWNGKYETQESK